jgi:hypothetical protein
MMIALLSLLVAQPALATPAPKTSPAARPAAKAAVRSATAATSHATASHLPAPSHKYPRGTRVEAKPKKGLIKELGGAPAHADPTALELAKTAPGKLTLRFVARDPQYMMNPQGAIAIQLNTDEGFELEPSVITRDEWPKNAGQVTVSYTGTPHGVVTAKASYGICSRKTRKCETVVQRSVFEVKP